MASFAEIYCAHYRVPPDRFVQSMFRRCLHPRAWLFLPFLKLLVPEYFKADYDLLRDVGRLTRADGLTEDLADYHTHPLNRNFARRRLRIRVSVGRVTREVHRLLPGRAPVTFYDSTRPAGERSNAGAGHTTPPHSASN